MYRDRPDVPRVVELEALIADEPALRVRLVPVQLELDEVQARADVLAIRLSEVTATLFKRREGGLVATVTGWFGRSLEDQERESIQLESELVTETARANVLLERARQLREGITASLRARIELDGLRRRAVDKLRAQPGELGDQVRALDAEDLRAQPRDQTIARSLQLVEAAREAVIGIRSSGSDHRPVRAAQLEGFDPLPIPLGPSGFEIEEDQRRIRISDAIGEAAIRVQELLSGYEDTRCEWRAQLSPEEMRSLFSGIRQLESVGASPSIVKSAALLATFDDLERELSAVRDRSARAAAEREARRIELAGLG